LRSTPSTQTSGKGALPEPTSSALLEAVPLPRISTPVVLALWVVSLHFIRIFGRSAEDKIWCWSLQFLQQIQQKPLRNEVRSEDITDQLSTQPIFDASSRFGPSSLFTTICTQLNLPANLFSRRSTANCTIAQRPSDVSIPRVRSVPRIKKSIRSLIWPHQNLVATG
jgi:hypothetical protein